MSCPVKSMETLLGLNMDTQLMESLCCRGYMKASRLQFRSLRSRCLLSSMPALCSRALRWLRVRSDLQQKYPRQNTARRWRSGIAPQAGNIVGTVLFPWLQDRGGLCVIPSTFTGWLEWPWWFSVETHSLLRDGKTEDLAEDLRVDGMSNCHPGVHLFLSLGSQHPFSWWSVTARALYNNVSYPVLSATADPHAYMCILLT